MLAHYGYKPEMEQERLESMLSWNIDGLDNGPGVTPEALARIGERFYRPPGQTATGSGLGLSIVQRIAKLHGMNVEFGNAEQGGFEAKVSW